MDIMFNHIVIHAGIVVRCHFSYLHSTCTGEAYIVVLQLICVILFNKNLIVPGIKAMYKSMKQYPQRTGRIFKDPNPLVQFTSRCHLL